MKDLKAKELIVLPINLQLFAGDDDSTDAVEDVVDLPDDNDSFDDWEDSDQPKESDDGADLEDIDDSDLGEKDQEVAKPGKKVQTFEENDQFKKMRLEAEKQARTKLDAELAEERAKLAAEKQALEQEKFEKKIMEEHLSQQKVWEKMDEEGVSEETAKKLLKIDAKHIIDEERQKARQRIDFIENQKRGLQNDKHFKLLESEVDNILRTRPDLDFQTVFYHMKGMRSEELDKQLLQNAEKRTVANMQDRARRRPLGGSDGGSDDSVTPSSVLDRSSMEMSIAFGNDPRKVAKYVKSNLKRKG